MMVKVKADDLWEWSEVVQIMGWRNGLVVKTRPTGKYIKFSEGSKLPPNYMMKSIVSRKPIMELEVWANG